jgi:hypothetical protein
MVMGPLLGPWLFEAFGPHAPVLAGLIAFAALSVYAFTITVPER